MGLKMSEGQNMSEHLIRFPELANQLRGLSPEGKEYDDSELPTILTLHQQKYTLGQMRSCCVRIPGTGY